MYTGYLGDSCGGIVTKDCVVVISVIGFNCSGFHPMNSFEILLVNIEKVSGRSSLVFFSNASLEQFRNMTSTCSSSCPESINCERYYNQSKFSSYPGGGERAI